MMPSPLHHLETDDGGTLLLYLANELPAEQRAAVERRLAADAAFRAEFERLRETYGWMEHALAAGDAAIGPSPSEAVAIRRVGQAVRRWHADRLARPPADASRTRETLLISLFRRQWMYPAAAAAIVLMALLASWSSRPVQPGTVILPEAPSNGMGGDDRSVAEVPPLAPPAGDPILMALATEGEQPMAEAERQMAALAALPEDLSAAVIPDLSAEPAAPELQ